MTQGSKDHEITELRKIVRLAWEYVAANGETKIDRSNDLHRYLVATGPHDVIARALDATNELRR